MNQRVMLVVGSRNFPRMSMVDDFMVLLPKDVLVLSGGARGVDSMAVLAAKDCGLTTAVIEADWTRYGKSAGPRRNVEMVKLATDVVAFWDGRSKGTAHTIGLAREAGKLRAVFKSGDDVGAMWADVCAAREAAATP